METSPIKIAIVGMTGAGKTVLISTLAMKMSQMADQGVFLAPVGEKRRQTLRYVQDNWQTLNSGKWPPSTPAGELIHLEWELTTKNNAATVRFADCAGQDVHAIFSQEQFNYNALTPDQKYVFDYLRSANVLIFLINMEDVLGRSSKQALENSLDVDQMFYVLNQKANFPRKTALVLSQFDKYRDELKAKYNNNLLEYLRANFPQLHGRYIQNPNFAVIPVAAVETTQTIIEDGMTKQVPVENFSSFNLKKLISWIAGAVDELAPMLSQADLSSYKTPSVDTPSIDNSLETGFSSIDTFSVDDGSLAESAIPVGPFEGAALIFPKDAKAEPAFTNNANVENNSQKSNSLGLGCSILLGIFLFSVFVFFHVASYIDAKAGIVDPEMEVFASFMISLFGFLLAYYCTAVTRSFFEKFCLKKLQNETDNDKYEQIEKRLKTVMYVSFAVISGFLFYAIFSILMIIPQMVSYLCIIPAGAIALTFFAASTAGYTLWKNARYSNMFNNYSHNYEPFFNQALIITFFLTLLLVVVFGLFLGVGLNALASMAALNIILIAILVIYGINKLVKLLKQKRNKDSL